MLFGITQGHSIQLSSVLVQGRLHLWNVTEKLDKDQYMKVINVLKHSEEHWRTNNVSLSRCLLCITSRIMNCKIPWINIHKYLYSVSAVYTSS